MIMRSKQRMEKYCAITDTAKFKLFFWYLLFLTSVICYPNTLFWPSGWYHLQNLAPPTTKKASLSLSDAHHPVLPFKRPWLAAWDWSSDELADIAESLMIPCLKPKAVSQPERKSRSNDGHAWHFFLGLFQRFSGLCLFSLFTSSEI